MKLLIAIILLQATLAHAQDTTNNETKYPECYVNHVLQTDTGTDDVDCGNLD